MTDEEPRTFDPVVQARMDRMLDELLVHPGRPRPAYLDNPARLQRLADEARDRWAAEHPADAA